MGKSQNNIKYITYSKAIAAILVVLYHTWGSMEIDTNVRNDCILFFFTTHVPTFMMISGYLYSNHTIKHDLTYRIRKLLNLLFCSAVYVFILVLFRVIVHSYLGIERTLLEEIDLSAHNMWYFPVLCFAIILYELSSKVPKKEGIIPTRSILFLLLIIVTAFLMYKNPSIGKILAYIIIFMIGTTWTINVWKAIFNALAYVGVWTLVVIMTGIVNAQSESSIGTELLLLMVLTVLGAGLILSLVYLLLQIKDNGSIIKHKNSDDCGNDSNKSGIIDSILCFICQNSQMFYFAQFIVIIVIEALRAISTYGYSVLCSLLYTAMCIICALIFSVITSTSAWANRLLCKPFN